MDGRRRRGKRDEGEEPVSKDQIQLQPIKQGVENKGADAGREGRNCLARPNFQVRTGTGKVPVPCSAHLYNDWQPHLLMSDLLYVMTIDT